MSNKKIQILKIALFVLSFAFSQSPEELKRFMETYDKIKNDQEANEIVKKGIESEKILMRGLFDCW